MISVVIPVYNEEPNLLTLHKRLSNVISRGDELIFVDDGSNDQSWDLISRLHREDNRVRAIRLSRNFGHQVALMAGIDIAKGNAVITMDADLQHPPEFIASLVSKWKEGYEVVYATRSHRGHLRLFKRLTSSSFYRLTQLIARRAPPPLAADFRLLDMKVVNELRKLKERTRFLRGLVGWVGFEEICIPYEEDRRHAGTSKYTFAKMVRLAVDGITAFSSFPLRLSFYFGLLVSILSFIYALYAIYVHFFTSEAVPGWTSVLVSVLFLGGVQLITLGIVGEYLSRVYEEVKERPLYIVRESLG